MKIGLIGAGAWGRNHLRIWHGLGVLAGVAESDAGRLAGLASKYPGVRVGPDAASLIEDPAIDGIAIATPPESHHPLVKACLLAGKDVLVERPLALDVAQGRELVELADRHRRILMVGHVLQYHPAIRAIKALVDRGELGRINYISSTRLNFGNIHAERSILWSFAPHDMSVMLMLLGELPTRVWSQGGCYLTRSIADVTVSTFEFRSGANAHLFVSWLHPFREQKLVVAGERQMVVFDDGAPAQKLVRYPHRIDWIDRQPIPQKAAGEVMPFDDEEPLRAELLHFLDCMRTRQTPRTDGAEGLRVLTLLAACQRSLDLGRPVELAAPAAIDPPYTAHPTSTIDEGCEIGAGTKIWHYSHVMRDSRIGRNCTIGQNVVVSPGCVLGDNVKVQNNVSIYTGVVCEDDVFLGPSMVFTNVVNPRSHVVRRDEYRPTLVRKGATIGANATIVCGHTIGTYAFVGAGAVVTRDVPDYGLVVGNPARQIGWMCRCGTRVEFGGRPSASCPACGQAYELTAGRMGATAVEVRRA